MLRSGCGHLDIAARAGICIAGNLFHRSREVLAELAAQHATSTELDDGVVLNVVGALVAFGSEKLVLLLACEGFVTIKGSIRLPLEARCSGNLASGLAT